ncbi:MAG: MFS transporter [Nocardioidaceae bacterium]|nr:MFS transporter [Nocardioidaceae bacterium]
MRAQWPPSLVWLVYRGGWGFIGTLSWTTAAVYFIRTVGMSPLELVLAGTALEVAYFLFEIPTAVVADLYSRRLSILIAAVLSGTAMIVIGLIPLAGWVIAGMALWGLGWTFRSGAEDAWLADELGSQRLGAAYQRGAQVARLTGLVGIGASVGLALIALWLPFVAEGTSALLLALVLALAMPEQGFTRADRERHPLNVVAGLGTARTGARVVRASPILLLVAVIVVLVGAFQEGFDRLWEAHLLLDVGLPPLGAVGDVAWFGILGAASLVLAFAVATPLVKRVERLRAERLARLLLTLHAVLLVTALTFALAGTLWLAVTAYLATAVVRDLVSAPFSTWLNEAVTDSSVRATVLSMTTVAGSLGEWTGGPTLGFIGNRWGVPSALSVGALALAPTLLLFARAIRHHGTVVDPDAGRLA